MIPIYKRQEASRARLQIVKQHDGRGGAVIQLIAVLEEFAQGRIMNFQLRSTDSFEALQKSSKHCVRFVDAKFALPKQQDNVEMAWDFVCLDTPEYPGEHDDIVVGFDTEEGQLSYVSYWPLLTINNRRTRHVCPRSTHRSDQGIEDAVIQKIIYDISSSQMP